MTRRLRIPALVAWVVSTGALWACSTTTGPEDPVTGNYILVSVDGIVVGLCDVDPLACDLIRKGSLDLRSNGTFVLFLQLFPTIENPSGSATVSGTFDLSGTSIRYSWDSSVRTGDLVAIEPCLPLRRTAITFPYEDNLLVFCPGGLI